MASATKPRDMGVYWETFKTDDGEAYYFCDKKGETTYDSPVETDPLAILLPFGWQAFAAEDGEPYFFHEGKNETDWDIPTGALFGKTRAAAPAAATPTPAVASSPASAASAASPLEKYDDTRVYWQTFLDEEKSAYYFQEDAGETTYDKPDKQVTLKDGRKVWPVLLPVGWIAADSSGEVYFADEQDNTSWELPADVISCAPKAAAAAPAPAPAPAPVPAPAAAAVAQVPKEAPKKAEGEPTKADGEPKKAEDEPKKVEGEPTTAEDESKEAALKTEASSVLAAVPAPAPAPSAEAKQENKAQGAASSGAVVGGRAKKGDDVAAQDAMDLIVANFNAWLSRKKAGVVPAFRRR